MTSGCKEKHNETNSALPGIILHFSFGELTQAKCAKATNNKKCNNEGGGKHQNNFNILLWFVCLLFLTLFKQTHTKA